MSTLLLAHAAVTWTLVGLIWTIQLVHYPLFAAARGAPWGTFHAEHARRVTWLVAPLMPAEVVCAGLLVLRAPSVGTWAGAALVGVIWLSTACLQMPAHQALADGYDARAHARLVRSNWIRTLAWSARGVLALMWLR